MVMVVGRILQEAAGKGAVLACTGSRAGVYWMLELLSTPSCFTSGQRPHTLEQVIAHMMPDLPNVGWERDIESFREFFENPAFRTGG